MKYLLLITVFFSFQAQAFLLNTSTGAAFGTDEVNIYITSNSTCTNAGFTKESLLEVAVSAANKFWGSVPTANISFKSGGILQTSNNLFLTGKLCATGCNTATDVPAVNDIVIACNSNSSDNFTSDTLLALTVPNNVSSSEIKGSVILLNDTATTSFKNLSSAELESLMAHEVGHAVGLGHTEDSAALMYYLNSSTRSKLGQDDIDGISYLYPNQFDGCKGLFGGVITSQIPPKNRGNGSFISSLVLGLSIGFLSLFLMINFTHRNLFHRRKQSFSLKNNL